MRKIRRAARLFLIAVLCCALFLNLNINAAHADYKFDDLDTNSGIGAQWVIITELNNGDTVGNPTSDGMDASGDLASGRNPVSVMNGDEETDNSENYREYGYPKIQTMLLVLSGANSAATDFTVNFGAPSQTDTYFGTNTVYQTNKLTYQPTGKSYYSNGYIWSQNVFSLIKSSRQNIYESVRTNFIFHENPYSEASQTLDVPMVIANVRQGSTASDAQLVFRTLLRDNQGTGDIAAYDHFTWNVQPGHDPAGNSQWVFVPVASLPVDENERINYRLTTAIANHTSRRYAVQRYDAYPVYQPLEASYWNFDLPYTRDNDDIARRFRLHYLSHIAPGLSTVYVQNYNVREADKRPYRLFQVDPATEYYTLSLNHKIIFGRNLGSAVKSGSGKYNPFAVTAFYLQPADPDFLANVAAKMGSSLVNVPNNPNFIGNTMIENEEVTADAIGSYKFERNIPDNLRSNGADAMLPLHITFNIPKTVLQAQGTNYWDAMLTQWYETGDVHDLFARYFSVYMLSREENSDDNHWNLIQQLQNDGVYNSLMKIFMDEDRGVITVSFMVMLMDGTRDSLRPAIDLVQDKTNTTDNTYIILRDGHNDNIWNMTFYVAPANFLNNNGTNENNGTDAPSFPATRPNTQNISNVTGNTDGTCVVSISQTNPPSVGTIFYLWLSTNYSEASLNAASTSGPYAAKITDNSGSLTIDPDYLYRDAACTSKASITGGTYYITYQSSDRVSYMGKTNQPVTLRSTRNNGSNRSSGGGGGGGCNDIYSGGILLLAALCSHIFYKNYKNYKK